MAFATVLLCGWTSAFAQTIRSQAVVDLTFDEADGNAVDSAAVGEGRNDGTLTNGVTRIPSPFWAQSGKRAVLLESAQKQFVNVADAADVDAARSVSLAFFYLNLVEPTDKTVHGIVSKRKDAKKAGKKRKRSTSINYGVSYAPQRDVFSVFVDDGTGVRPVIYGVKDVLGYRRRAYLTVTLEVGDAPDPETDTEPNDLRVNLYVNGQPVAPKKVVKGLTVGNDAWITGLALEGLLNDGPLTLGGSTPYSEFADGLIDEFSLFPRALTPSEAAGLFAEVAGLNGTELAKKESEPETGEPQITAISQRGLQIGTTTTVTIDGRNLTPNPAVVLPIPGVTQKILKRSTERRLVVALTLPDGIRAGFYPLNVKTEKGISKGLTIAVDRLPQVTNGGESPDKPASLPAAFSGTLSGSDVARVYFQGKRGDRVVADVESKRLGADMDPVLEIKNARGAPMAIEWGMVQLHNDTRAELELPADGLYSVELHDLAYRARGNNPFRLKVGNLNLVDSVFPPAAAPGSKAVLEPVGTGFSPGTLIAAQVARTMPGTCELVDLPGNLEASGPAPVLRVSEGAEFVEKPQPDGSLQRLSAEFTVGTPSHVTINGRIARPDEEDVYLLDVIPEQKLNLSVEARAMDSPLDGALMIREHPSGKRLAKNSDRPGTRDPGMEYVVPNDVHQIEVAIRDMYGRGGSHFVYRLRVQPAGKPDFRITLLSPLVNLPMNGNAVVQLEVQRLGYQGPIRLTVLGDDDISVTPSKIPAGKGNSNSFVTLSHSGSEAPAEVRRLRIVGESVGLSEPVRSVARLSSQFDDETAPGYRDTIPTAFTAPNGVSLDVTQMPQTLYRGLDTKLGVKLTRSNNPIDAGHYLRFELVSTQAVRQSSADPRNPFSVPKPGNKPVTVARNQAMTGQDNEGKLEIDVPAEVTDNAIDFVLRAEVVPHPYSNHVLGTLYSKPFRLAVKNAVDVDLVPESLVLRSGRQGKLRGTVKRGEPFNKAIEIEVVGFGTLLPGFSASKVTVPPDQDRFELVINAAKVNEELTIPITRLRVTTEDGVNILPDRALPLKVMPDKSDKPEETAEAGG